MWWKILEENFPEVGSPQNKSSQSTERTNGCHVTKNILNTVCRKPKVLGSSRLQESTLCRKLCRENTTGLWAPDRGVSGLFYPPYLAHFLTHDRNSIYTPHSFTKGRKGRREKGKEAHLSGYTLDFVASYWWSSMVTSIFNFTSCWHLLNITVYSWLILYHHMPQSPIEVWIGSYSVCPKYNFVTTGASVFCNYAPGLWNLFPVEIKRGASVVEIRLKQRRYMYLLITLIFAVILIWFSFDFLYSLHQYLTKW